MILTWRSLLQVEEETLEHCDLRKVKNLCLPRITLRVKSPTLDYFKLQGFLGFSTCDFFQIPPIKCPYYVTDITGTRCLKKSHLSL